MKGQAMDIERIRNDIEQAIAKSCVEQPDMRLQMVVVAPALFEALRESDSDAASKVAETHRGVPTMPMFGTKVVQYDEAETDEAFWVSMIRPPAATVPAEAHA